MTGSERQGALVLGGAVLLAIILLGGIRALTAERTANARAERLAASLDVVLAGLPHDAVSAAREVPIGEATDGGQESRRMYRVRRDGQSVGAVLNAVTHAGYSGTIELLVGVRASGTITGVSVLSHRETPGLGDRIERRRGDWITHFTGRSIDTSDPSPPAWRVVRAGTRAEGSFDALSGATITSRAVVDAVREALLDFATHRETLLGEAIPTR